MTLKRLTPPLLIALVVSGLCTLVIGRQLKVHTVQKIAMLSYLVPNRAIPAGEILRADSLQTVEWPADHAVPGVLTKPADAIGRAMLYPIGLNQPLTEQMLSAPGAGTGLAGRIPDGMRAIAMRSDEVMGVAGFLLPGSHLDVLVTYHTEKSPDPRTVTVLQNAEVIAVGQQIQPDPQGKPATVSVVTLLLAPGDAERAVLASAQGTIHFVMRSGSDRTQARDGGVTLAQLADPSLPAEALPSPLAAPRVHVARPVVLAAPRPVHQQVVQTISGDKQVNATFDEVVR